MLSASSRCLGWGVCELLAVPEELRKCIGMIFKGRIWSIAPQSKRKGAVRGIPGAVHGIPGAACPRVLLWGSPAWPLAELMLPARPLPAPRSHLLKTQHMFAQGRAKHTANICSESWAEHSPCRGAERCAGLRTFPTGAVQQFLLFSRWACFSRSLQHAASSAGARCWADQAYTLEINPDRLK